MVPGGDLDCRAYIIAILGKGHADGHHLINAGIRAVQQARHTIETNFGQRGPKFVD